jgi:hypothetical protein
VFSIEQLNILSAALQLHISDGLRGMKATTPGLRHGLSGRVPV